MTYRTASSGTPDATSYACPVANADRYFPRPHPSATTVAKLGVASLLFGPIAGMPAVLLGRLVLREIAAGAGAYRGENDAQLGLALGWTGTFLWGSLMVYLAASSSTALGLGCVVAGCAGAAAMGVGKLWAGAPARLRVFADRPMGAVWPIWSAVLLLLVLGDVGLYRKRRAEEEAQRVAAQTCVTAVDTAIQALGSDAFGSARDHLAIAYGACSGATLVRVAELQASLPGREAAHKERVQREEAERRARLQARREQEEAARFETAAEEISARLSTAVARASEKRWFDVRDELDGVEKALQRFAGTKAGASVRWKQLDGRLAELRKQWTPEVERAEKKRVADEEAKQKREEAREAARRVICCDGTVSPSCRCAAESQRGCCSHHQGICGCQD